MTRRFEYVGGNSAKFWDVDQNGGQVTVHYGRLGAQGQTQTKTLANADKAAQHAEKLIGEKLRKGYVAAARSSAIARSRLA